MLELAFGKAGIRKTLVYVWYKHFLDGCVSVNRDSLCGQLSTLTVEKTSSTCMFRVTDEGLFRKYQQN
jgi:hypothetical protein